MKKHKAIDVVIVGFGIGIIIGAIILCTIGLIATILGQ